MTQREHVEKPYGGPVPNDAECDRRQLDQDRARTYLNTKQAADYLGLSRQFLEKGRNFGTGPPFVVVTAKCIRYRRADLDQWMADTPRRRWLTTAWVGRS